MRKLLLMLLFLTGVGLADGSIAHFDGAEAVHGVFRSAEDGVYLFISRENHQEFTPTLQDHIVLSSEQLELMDSQLRKLGVADAGGASLRLRVVGSKDGYPYALTVPVNRQSYGPMIRAIHLARRSLESQL